MSGAQVNKFEHVQDPHPWTDRQTKLHYLQAISLAEGDKFHNN